MKRLYLALATLSFIAVGCQDPFDNYIDGTIKLHSVEAIVSEMPQTRATLEDGHNIVWELNDQIGIFSDTDDAIPFTKVETGNTFTSSTPLSGNKFYAFYPYNESVFDHSNRNNLDFSIDDSTTAGGANPTLKVPMVAISDGTDFSFKQTCGVLHIAITGNRMLNSITLKGNNNEKIGGLFSVDLGEDIPILTGAGYVDSLNFTPEYPELLSKTEAYDVYFILPPMTFEDGISITLNYNNGDDKSIVKSTSNSVIISRAIISNFTLDLDAYLQQVKDDELTLERNALIALYNATNGTAWKNNTNWCSDKPVSEWYGVETNLDGFVRGLELGENNLNGAVPATLSNLTHLSTLRLHANHITAIDNNIAAMSSLSWLELSKTALGEFPMELIKGGNLSYLGIMDCNFMAIPDEAFSYLSELKELNAGSLSLGAATTVPIPSQIGQLKKLRVLQMIGYAGDIPEGIYTLTELVLLNLPSQKMTGTISPAIGNLTKLECLGLSSTNNGETLEIPRNQLSGSIPSELFEKCTELISLSLRHTHLNGEIPASIGNLRKLQHLSLINNDLTGNLPPELCNLPIERWHASIGDLGIEMYGNKFSGKVPAAFKNWKPWNYFWYQIIAESDLDISDAMPSNPDFNVTLLNGSSYSSSGIKDNELTVLFQWATWCPHLTTFLPTMKAAYEKFHNKGFDIIGWSSEEESTINGFLSLEGISWNNFRAIQYENSIIDNYTIYGPYYPDNGVPGVTIFDSSGQLVWSDRLSDRNDFKPFLESWFGESFEADDMYESTDFSKDGNVMKIQSATEGAGIDIVIMADGFSDRQINAGMYRSAVDKTVNAFFAEEPYKSNKDKFNVYMVEVVSQYENYTGETPLETFLGEGTVCGGNNEKVLAYADNPFPAGYNMDDCLVIVLMNTDKYAGTCYYITQPDSGDYGRGNAIAYIPLYSVADEFAGTVRHEAGGHGFAKFADEYSYQSNGAIPQARIDELRSREQYGWWKNVDFTSDPANVKWHQFINDSRYESEGIGVFEGAVTYATGAYRATSNSIMNQNTDGFNAPSRYAIWYRINKLAYGVEWSGTYEDFVTWDLAHQAVTRSAKVSKAKGIKRELPPLASPVFVKR